MHTATNNFHNHKNVKVYVLSISPINYHDRFCHHQLCVCLFSASLEVQSFKLVCSWVAVPPVLLITQCYFAVRFVCILSYHDFWKLSQNSNDIAFQPSSFCGDIVTLSNVSTGLHHLRNTMLQSEKASIWPFPFKRLQG